MAFSDRRAKATKKGKKKGKKTSKKTIPKEKPIPEKITEEKPLAEVVIKEEIPTTEVFNIPRTIEEFPIVKEEMEETKVETSSVKEIDLIRSSVIIMMNEKIESLEKLMSVNNSQTQELINEIFTKVLDLLEYDDFFPDIKILKIPSAQQMNEKLNVGGKHKKVNSEKVDRIIKYTLGMSRYKVKRLKEMIENDRR